MKKFHAKYEIDDGYAGGARPQYFSIYQAYIDDDMTDEELEAMFYDMAHEDMLQKVSVYGKSDDFIEWAKAVIAERNKRGG